MGSLPPQGTGTGTVGTGSGIVPSTVEDEAITVTTTFTNKLLIDSRDIRDSVITIFNEDPTATLSFRIFGTNKDSTTIPPDADDSWINILRPIGGSPDDSDPANYNDNLAKTIPALGLHYESFSNKWTFVRVQMATSVGTISARAWHRGTN